MKRIALTAIAITTITLTGCSKNELVSNKFESKLYPEKKVVANANKENENKVCKLEDRPVVKPARSEEKKGYIKEIDAELTFYTLAECGKHPSDPWYGITASGTKAKVGRTIAMDKSIPFNTKVLINGKVYIVEDRGGKVRGNVIDVLVGSESEARKLGRQKTKVYILEWGNGKTQF